MASLLRALADRLAPAPPVPSAGGEPARYSYWDASASR